MQERALLVLSFLCGQAVFLEWFRDCLGPIAFAYWLFLIWAAIRFGRHGATLVVFMTGVQGRAGAAHHTGLFVTPEDPTGLLNCWCYMVVLSCVGLALALTLHERERVTRELRSSEERLRRYFDLGLIGMAITSVEMNWLEFNEPVCAVLGYSREELAGRTDPSRGPHRGDGDFPPRSLGGHQRLFPGKALPAQGRHHRLLRGPGARHHRAQAGGGKNDENLDRVARNILRNFAEPFPLGEERVYKLRGLDTQEFPETSSRIVYRALASALPLLFSKG